MTAIIEKNTGRLVKTISAPEDVIRLNTPEDCYATEDPPDKGMYHIGGEWQYLPPCPGEGYVFDYADRHWVDPRSIEDIKAQKWAEIKSQRNQLEVGGFEFEGGIYDSDQVSQGRIMGAAMAGADQTWTLANNSTVNLTASQLQQLYAALQEHISSIHERSRIAREKIENAQTVAEVEAVTL